MPGKKFVNPMAMDMVVVDEGNSSGEEDDGSDALQAPSGSFAPPPVTLGKKAGIIKNPMMAAVTAATTCSLPLLPSLPSLPGPGPPCLQALPSAVAAVCVLLTVVLLGSTAAVRDGSEQSLLGKQLTPARWSRRVLCHTVCSSRWAA